LTVIVGNETYVRTVFDSEDITPIYTVDGKEVEVDQISDLVEKGGKLELSQVIDEEAQRIKVTFRPLRAIDKTQIENTIQMEYGSDTAAMAPGSMRRLAIKRAVVKWDYTTPWTDNVLDNLDSAIFEQLYAWVSWGSEPLAQSEETGLPIPLEEPVLNRAQRRATKKSQPKVPETATNAS
jgi:hypothetical protein